MQKINFSDIKPFVRYSQTLILPPDFSTTDVHACDNRLVYIFSGNVKVKLNDKTFTATRGALFIYPSSTKYSIVNLGNEDAKIMSVNFDYITASGRSTSPIPTIPDRLWHRTDAVEDISFEDIDAFNSYIHLSGMQSLERIFADMNDEFVNTKPFSSEALGLLIHQALIFAARRIALGNGQKMTGLVYRIIDYIQENYACDLSNEEIGKHFNYHPNYINRVIQKHTGLSLHQYVLSCRVSKALEMLQTSGLSVTEVAERVGFSSIKHFSQTFKSIYGYSPIHFKD